MVVGIKVVNYIEVREDIVRNSINSALTEDLSYIKEVFTVTIDIDCSSLDYCCK